ncbi:MAG: hypothetical protein APF76_02590 [Desulfitibacter sp. BRH_c19]|nr:MAG: hypothetical protein APF76_02590 [Desulfitibacter sp. BRH_c19]
MAKRIAISGYYGFQNIGDEAILFSMLQAFDTIGDIKTLVFSNSPEHTQKQYQVAAIDRWKLVTLFKELGKTDQLVSGGGSLLQDVTGPKSLIYYLGVVFLAKLLRKKVMFYAQGIGPINTSLGKKLMGWLANKADLITVRDEASKKLLEQLGVNKPEIRVTVDAVLGIDRKQVNKQAGEKKLEEMGITMDGEPIIGISLREWQNPDNYKKAVAKTCDNLIEMGYRVMFIPFHFPSDITPGRDTIKFMKHGDKAILVKNQTSVEEMLGILSKLHMIVGMRLHSLIMAAVMGVPIVGISYDPKVDSFLKQTYQPLAGRAETITEDELWDTVRTALDKRDASLPEYLQIIDEKREQALETARWALEL